MVRESLTQFLKGRHRQLFILQFVAARIYHAHQCPPYQAVRLRKVRLGARYLLQVVFGLVYIRLHHGRLGLGRVAEQRRVRLLGCLIFRLAE